MKIFDLHCDTLGKIYKANTDFNCELNDITPKKTENYKNHTAVYAFFSSPEYSNGEAFRHYVKARNRFLSLIADAPENMHFAFSIEDARLLEHDLERINFLISCGIRIITPLWRGESIIGGAYDTKSALTPFGHEATAAFCRAGIIPDVSHASRESFSEICEIADENNIPIIATHSNSQTVCPHKRNLSDEQFLKIKKRDGIVGISFADEHVMSGGGSSISDVIKHIEHYLSLGGEDTVCIGSDFDGILHAPTGLGDASCFENLQNELARLNYTQVQTDKIFFDNADGFFRKYIKFNL